MNTKNTPENYFVKGLAGVVFAFVLIANADAGATALATQPFTSTNAVTALPNVMFVLDDSGSMDFDYLPDWAGPYKDFLGVTIQTPTNRFFNSAYNGVAYNPATRYRPPVMYTSAGALDTSTYPSQTGQSVAQGGDVGATVGVPNWRAVKKDGYGIQATTTTNLEGNAFFYTTVPGEYCTTAQLRNCTASAAPTGSYTFPARLRWCTTALKSVDTTANSNGFCQASNIADTPTNTTNGVTHYTFPRIAAPRNATITLGAGGVVTGVTVDGLQILSASAAGANGTGLASAIVTQVNACTLKLPGLSNCTVVGYSATSSGNVVTLAAPGSTSASPVVTGGTSSVTAFAVGNVRGESLLTVITPSVSSYPYPGTAAKGVNRTDCSGTTCTHAEEMTNYANWYAYYRTRMQMMKTSSSIAFSSVDEKFRVGYYSINNGTGSDFLNLNPFDATQKNLWYIKFFSATPFGATPLRLGLANAGRMYANKLSTLNGQSVTDPMQYSCQQNFTILSTDGFWNDTSMPMQVDGTTEIGQQDGNDPRPYYDGATQTKTVSDIKMTQQQLAINTFLVESKTQQKQAATRRLTQSVVTTTTYPWKEESTFLQTRTTPLNKTEWRLRSRTFPLTSTTRELEERTFQLQSTTFPLQRYTFNLTKTTTPLQENQFNITSVTTPLQAKVFNIKSVTTPLQAKVFNIKSVTTPLQAKVFNIKSVTTPLQQKQFNLISKTYALQKNTFQLQSSTFQLQKRSEVSTNGGDTWIDTGWIDVSSCEVRASGPGFVRNTQCRYNTPVVASNLDACSSVAASTGPNYTVAQAVSCAYQATPSVQEVTSCTAVGQSGSSPFTPSVTCTYTTTPVTLTNQTSCVAVAQSGGATKTGPSRTCEHETTAVSTTDVGTCTPVSATSAPKITCGYTGTTTTLTNQAACTPLAQSTSAPYSGPARTCTHETTAASTTDVTSCTAVTPNPAATPKTTCGYTGTVVTLTNQTSCASVTASTGNPYSGPARVCTHETTAASTTDVTSCTAVTPNPAATPKTTCTYTGTTVTLNGQTACTAIAQSTANTYVGPARTCTHETTAASTTDVASCTPASATSAPMKTCTYTGSATTLNNQTSCTPLAQSTSAPYAGPARTCAHATTAASSTTVTSCNATTPNPASSPKITCTYTGTQTVQPGQTTCTPVAQSTSNTYTGPAVACAWEAAVVATNLTTCSPTGSNAGPPFSAYTTCGYGGGTTVNNLNACTLDPAEAGPSYSNGSYTACAYQTSYLSTNVTSCSPVAQSPTFSAPEKTCVYAAATTFATNLANCTDVPQSTSAPYAGPAVTCAYSGTASVTNNNAATCTENRQTSSPFTGPAVDCTYRSPTTTNNVTSCTEVAQSTGPNYVGPATACDYGTPGTWSNATSTCTAVAPSTGPSFFGPVRDCQYTSTSDDQLLGTCTDVPQSAGSPYSVLTAKNCVAGAFPVVGSAVDTTVDSCSTAPTSTGAPIVISTVTSCTYQAPVTVDAATCTPAPQSVVSPFTTEVTCPVSNTGWVPVAPTCTVAGTPPSAFDGAGKIVECRTTDITGTASAPIPVASCAGGTNATTKEQTHCTTLLNTGPTPVQTCTDVAPASPDYVRTSCFPSSNTATVMGCTPQVPTSPSWQTITCVNDGSGTSNTLADVSAYYYKTDLRTPTLGNCVGAVVPPAATGSDLCSLADPMNNVPTTPGDPNNAQHMTTFTLGLGASGYMKYSDTYVTDTIGDFPTVKGVSPFAPANGIAADPANGICSWQAGGHCNWPFPSSNEQTTIDDLWHAGINGRGAYFSATDPVSLANSITSALAGVAAAGGAAAAPSLSTPSLTPADSYLFSSTYTTSDWTGEVVRFLLNPFTGLISPVADWAAQAKLDANVSRAIYVFDSSVATTKLKAFTGANYGANAYFASPHISTAPSGLTQFLCASVDTCLSPADQTNAAGVNLVNYLRGERTNEGTLTDNTKFYRQRQHVLGDMVNAQLVYVRKPGNGYADPGYSDFVTAQSARQAVVYAGANDGMLHAFAAKGTSTTETAVEAAAEANAKSFLDPGDAALLADAATKTTAANTAVAADTIIGQELWAYIPSIVMPDLYKLADKKYKDKHRYYVDATPVVGDICVSDCNLSSAVWKTILVGGLGRGGRGYYALDITDPVNPKALWEFTNANLGYSYGNPQIVKLANGSWVVLLASGYNNIPNADAATGDGVGRLFVLDAASGTQVSGIPVISTGAGDASSPSGLAKISAQVVNPVTDNTVVAVYGGDLLGNLWRFDVNDTIGAAGYDAQSLATLKDGAGNAQPITTKPEIGLIQGQIVVFVGTGRYLDGSDAADDSPQSLYAIKDPRTPLTSPGVPVFANPGGSPRASGTSTAGFVGQVQTEEVCSSATPTICAAGEVIRTSTNNPVNFLSDNGWYVDLVGISERANTDPALGLGLLAFNTNAPSLLACDVGGKSYSYFLNYLTGGPIDAPGIGIDGNPNTIVGLLLANQLASAPTLVMTKSGKLVIVSGLSGGGFKVTQPPLGFQDGTTRRTSWRELIRGN
ncbi:MAG: hypothetical protein CVU16_06085 [Betaproteobacteria bacterium HGW-Betaproteobacteria-10]|nr:MAG: hypothetical protein CVU16_06085 [Betaproteobacteria bacterium HGW-Betaproteobacteria-10]